MSKRKRIIAFISVFIVLLSTLLPFTAAAWDIVVSDKYTTTGEDDSVSVYTPPNAFISFSYPFFDSGTPTIQNTNPTMNFLNYLTTEAYLGNMGRDSFTAYLPPSNPFGETQFYVDVNGYPIDDINGYLYLDTYALEIDAQNAGRTDKTVFGMYYYSTIAYPYFPAPIDYRGALDFNDLWCYFRVEDSYFVEYRSNGELFRFHFDFNSRSSSRDFWADSVVTPTRFLPVKFEYSFLGSDVVHTYEDWLFINEYVDTSGTIGYDYQFVYRFVIDNMFPGYSQLPAAENGAYVDSNGKEFPGIYIHSFSVGLPLSSFCDSSLLNLEFVSYTDPSLLDYRTLDLEAKMANFNPEDVPLTVSWLGTAVGGFFDLQIVPGFSLGGIFLIIIAFSVVMWFLKVFGGG